MRFQQKKIHKVFKLRNRLKRKKIIKKTNLFTIPKTNISSQVIVDVNYSSKWSGHKQNKAKPL